MEHLKPRPIEPKKHIPCTSGACSGSTIRENQINQVPGSEGVLSLGMRKVLTNMYGTCGAKDALNHIYDDPNQHYRYNLTGKRNDPDRSMLYISGISQKQVDKGYDNVRGVNSKASTFGPYTAKARGAKQCTNKVKVGNEWILPSKVHKVFGNGPGGMLVNGKFSVFSCASKTFLNSLSDAQKAYTCGLTPGSKEKDQDYMHPSPPAITIDCAELIGSSAIAACKKLHPNQTFGKEKNMRLNGRFLSTGSLLENECMKTPKITPENPIASGDVFVLGGHAIMINKVGNDPFGIGRARGNCNAIAAHHFDFSFSHSSSFKEIGPIQSTAKAYNKMVYSNGYGANYYPLSELVIMARKMCRDKKQNRGSGLSSNFLQAPVNGKSVRQLRHQSNNPNCSYPKGKCPSFEGKKCAEVCGVK